jgi:hypothetical protein
MEKERKEAVRAKKKKSSKIETKKNKREWNGRRRKKHPRFKVTKKNLLSRPRDQSLWGYNNNKFLAKELKNHRYQPFSYDLPHYNE